MNRSNGRLVSIYVLMEPDTLAIRYVGWSSNVDRRLKAHIISAKIERNHRAHWIRSLLSAGKRPILKVVEDGVIDFAFREKFWIAHYRAERCNLTNGTDGGEGMLGYHPTDETRRKIAVALIARHAPGTFTGCTHSPDARLKMSEARSRRITKPETRLKISKALTGRTVTQATRDKFSRIHRERLRHNEAAVLQAGWEIGRWKLIQSLGKFKWQCVCSCGTIRSVLGSNLVRGGSLSCGCLQRELTSKAILRHGESRGPGKTPEYSAWRNMIVKCYNPNAELYPAHGALGITVCERWRRSYEAFLSDLGRRPTQLHGVDLWPDRNGNYEPGNVRWAIRKERRISITRKTCLTFGGKSMLLSHWAAEQGLTVSALSKRITRGWPVEKALTVALE